MMFNSRSDDSGARGRFVRAASAGGVGGAVVLLLAACQAPPPASGPQRPFSPDVPPPPQLVSIQARCDASQSRFALGQVVDKALLEQARDRTGAHEAVSAQAGQAPTPADPMRLILEVDAQGKMVGARCG